MRIVDALGDLLVGAACPGCAAPSWGACPSCRNEVAAPRLRMVVDGMDVIGLAGYAGPAGRMVRSLKESGAWSVARVCGPGLGRSLDLLGSPGLALVPVPSSASAIRRRGFHHSLALARAARRPTDRVADVLRRNRTVADQAGLDQSARQGNQLGSMRPLGPADRVAEAVVVDDICTTGATLAEAAHTLRTAGWRVAGAVVVAITERNHH